AECHQIGVTLLAFFPTLYCDVTDSWMLPNKWQRIIIGAAGMIVESVLASIALFVWRFTNDGTVNAIALNVFFVSAVTTVIFNINPLMRLDGYYMLSDFWEIPNLRQLATQAQQAWFAKLFLGAELVSSETSAHSDKSWLVAFALASALYGWSVMGGMLLMLHTALKPYGLQSVGTTLATLAGTSFLIGTAMSTYRITRMPRTQPLRPYRVAASVIIAGLLVVAFFFVPIPWYRSATFMLEPRDVRHVHTQAPGDLVRLHVKPGDHVEVGQVLAELDDPAKRDRRRQLLVDRQVQRQEIALYEAIDDPATAAVAREALASVERELAELDADLKLLTLTAPCTGMIVAPAKTPRAKMEQAKVHLEHWTGTPLDEKNVHCFLQERTHLLDIAPGPQKQALIYLDQADLGDVRPAMELHLKFDEHSDQTYSGFIRTISSAQFDEVPANLSTKHGGQLATVTGNDNKERVQDALYKIEVDLPSEFPGLQSELRGEARFLVTDRTAARWVWRAFQRTFNFRL
ncbi:MAG: biotin/lipoyl-binding protein, partial [Planctomycetaceae bacterium]|nr:biotin/lipoyl-binding protein [Planctomycetaceae bacterium]